MLSEPFQYTYRAKGVIAWELDEAFCLASLADRALLDFFALCDHSGHRYRISLESFVEIMYVGGQSVYEGWTALHTVE